MILCEIVDEMAERNLSRVTVLFVWQGVFIITARVKVDVASFMQPDFKLNAASADAWIASGYSRPK